MNKIRIIIVMLLTVIIVVSSVDTAEAQRRRRKVVTRAVVKGPHRVRHTVVVRRAHVRYHHLPRWRAVVTTVPATAVVIKTRSTPYYYYDGIYYEQRNVNYVVVRPSRGVRIRVLPAGYRTVVLGPHHYYYYYGTFYTQVDKRNEYETIDAPEGAVVDALPDGYEVKMVNGNEYYVLDDVYYAEVDAPEFDDGVGYEVIRL